MFWLEQMRGLPRQAYLLDESEDVLHSTLECFLFDGMLDVLHHRPLSLRADLLGLLERDEGELKVVRGLLHCRLLSWLHNILH